MAIAKEDASVANLTGRASQKDRLRELLSEWATRAAHRGHLRPTALSRSHALTLLISNLSHLSWLLPYFVRQFSVIFRLGALFRVHFRVHILALFRVNF